MVALVLPAVLDRIDEIVPPATNVYEPNGPFDGPLLADPAPRRRPARERAAS